MVIYTNPAGECVHSAAQGFGLTDRRVRHMHYKNFWILLIMLLAGIVLGGFMGQLAEGISWLNWLNFGQSFGLDSPLVINFGILVITFGLTIKITMASIIGVAVALIIYRYI